MRRVVDLAQFGLKGAEDPAQALAAQTLHSCLRYLQREAKAAGLPMTAHLIGTASLAVLEESIPGPGSLAN